MSADQKSQEPQADVTAVTGPAPGGTLAEFVAYVQSLGRPAAISPDGRQAWVPGASGELQRFPLECNEPADSGFVRGLLRLPAVRMVSYLVEGDQPHVPNCFDYVCSDSEYRVDTLASYARRDIRRGLRTFDVRLCTWDDLAAKGQPAVADTAGRHGYAQPSPQWLADMISRQGGTPFYEVWGAWREGDLAAWMTVIKIDDWAMIDIARSCTDALKGCPNNAIGYLATRQALVAEKRSYVTYGLSSIQVDVNEKSMHKYKTRMGYELLPRCRVFEAGRLLKAAVGSRALSWLWERAAKLRPDSANLRKLAGMSRIVSGREKDPLAWAQEEKKGAE